MHLSVIASLKSGMEHFIYREVSDLAAHGATISIFPTKHRSGLYNPRPEWRFHPWSAWQVVLVQPWRLLAMPLRYLATLWTAIRYGEVTDFLLAAYFTPYMKDVDVIYATFGDRKLFVGFFCKLLTDKPLAVALHAYELYQNPNPKLFPFALAACDQVITVTEYNRELLGNQLGIPAKDIEVVRLSVDLDEYKPEKKFVVLIVAFFVEKKGHEVLFDAIARMKRDDVEVWVVGGSGGASTVVDVEALARKYGLESQVAFFGKLKGTALKAVYHACDVFCLPSRFDREGEGEGFPTVIIEAMACGKPVVTTRHVEIPRIVERIVVEENDAAALAEALEAVYQSSGLRQELGERNRELAEEHFSEQNMLRKWLILQRTASGHGREKSVRSDQRANSDGFDEQLDAASTAPMAESSLECTLR
jgi:colanic acid/amylovoran biosynthesis glycosyltransferase